MVEYFDSSAIYQYNEPDEIKHYSEREANLQPEYTFLEDDINNNQYNEPDEIKHDSEREANITIPQLATLHIPTNGADQLDDKSLASNMNTPIDPLLTFKSSPDLWESGPFPKSQCSSKSDNCYWYLFWRKAIFCHKSDIEHYCCH